MILVALMICSAGTAFAYLVEITYSGWWNISAPLPPLLRRNFLYGVSLILSLVNNMVATSVFAFKLWSHRRLMDSIGLARKQPSQSQKVMSIIVDSGMIYFVIQLYLVFVQFINGLDTNGMFVPLDVGTKLQILSDSIWLLAGMYPAIVMVLVNQQNSVTETFPELSIVY